MLAEPDDDAFTRDGWLFELKLDGYRLLASKSRGEALLLTRNGNDYTGVFPEVARAVKALPYDELHPRRRSRRARRAGPAELLATAAARPAHRRRSTSNRAAVELPATYFAFDFLAFEDFDLRSLPLLERKALLMEALPKLGAVRALDHIEREGEAFLEQVDALGLEGIIAKRADVPYRAGRTRRLAQDQGGARPATSSSSASPRRRDRAAISARCSSPTW